MSSDEPAHAVHAVVIAAALAFAQLIHATGFLVRSRCAGNLTVPTISADTAAGAIWYLWVALSQQVFSSNSTTISFRVGQFVPQLL
jgi:hypothetical protein